MGNARKKELLKVAITEKIRDLDMSIKMKGQVLGKGFVTTFWRIVGQQPSWNVFGFNLSEEGNLYVRDKDFDKKLKVIIFDVIKKVGFQGKLFSRLNGGEIENYLKQISEKDYQRVAEELKKQANGDPSGGDLKPSPGKKKGRPKSTDRKYLIPNDFELDINEIKINNIYHELKYDLLISNSSRSVPNAVGVLFRVFMEISLDHYAKTNGHTFGKNHTIRKKIPWVVEKLKSKGHDEIKFRNITKVGSAAGEESYLSIENFHEYVHSTKTQPTSGDLKGRWDNLQEFFQILWDDINKDEK